MFKNNLKRNYLLIFFCSREKGRLKWRNLSGGFASFKLIYVLSITKHYMADITFSDICNFPIKGILICKMLVLSKWKTHWFAF